MIVIVLLYLFIFSRAYGLEKKVQIFKPLPKLEHVLGNQSLNTFLITRDVNKKYDLKYNVQGDIQKEQLSLLHLAVFEKNMNAIMTLVEEHGADVNIADKDRDKPLHVAAAYGNPEIINYLIDHGALLKKNKKGKNPLQIALDNCSHESNLGNILILARHYNKLEKLKEYLNNAGLPIKIKKKLLYIFNKATVSTAAGSFLHQVNLLSSIEKDTGLATIRLYLDMFPSLLYEKGRYTKKGYLYSTTNTMTLYDIAIYLEKYDIVGELLVRIGQHLYLIRGSVGVIHEQKKLKEVFNSIISKIKTLKSEEKHTILNHQDFYSGNTALHELAKFNRKQPEYELFKKLITEVDEANTNIQNKYGQTSLHIAVGKGDLSSVQELINKKTDLNMQDLLNQSPLHIAARNGKGEMVDVLIVGGAGVNSQNSKGQTPLHIAVTLKSTSVLEKLLANGAEIDAADNMGNTPLARAVINGNEKAVELLLKKGADVNILVNNTTPLKTYAEQQGLTAIKDRIEEAEKESAAGSSKKTGIDKLKQSLTDLKEALGKLKENLVLLATSLTTLKDKLG